MSPSRRPDGTAGDLPFIVTIGQAKVDPSERKLIRSHVMRGKNRVKPKKTRAAKSEVVSPGEAQANATCEKDPLVLVQRETVPRWMSAKFSGIRFADEIEAPLVEDIYSLLLMSTKAMFMLDQCIVPNVQGMVKNWFAPLLYDAAYLHVASLTTQAFFDNYTGRTRTAQARRWEYTALGKSIQILGKRIASNDEAVVLSESNLMTVLLLSGYAYTQGDHRAAHHHNKALLALVKWKGANEVLQFFNAKLANEIIRTEFCTCYENGQKPELFTYEDIPWPLILPPGHSSLNRDPEDLESRLDPELSAIWAAMSHFCTLMNVAARSPASRITEDTFLHIMGSVMYRILHLHFEEDSLDECMRLGLLAFAAPAFLDWKNVYWINGHFIRVWRLALDNLLRESTLKPRDQMWLLMMGTLSMAHDVDFLARLIAGMRNLTEACGVCDWDDMRELLRSYVWIGTLFDKPGSDVFNSVLSHSGEALTLTRRHDGPREVLQILDTRPYTKNMQDRPSQPEREYKVNIYLDLHLLPSPRS